MNEPSLRTRYYEAALATGLSESEAWDKADECLTTPLLFRADAAADIETLVSERIRPAHRPKQEVRQDLVDLIREEGPENFVGRRLAEYRSQLEQTREILQDEAQPMSDDEKTVLVKEEVERARKAWNLYR